MTSDGLGAGTVTGGRGRRGDRFGVRCRPAAVPRRRRAPAVEPLRGSVDVLLWDPQDARAAASAFATWPPGRYIVPIKSGSRWP